ncbi:MAG: PepSY-associated TM helix domain-containing protein [Steroidobacteraceae bacterium]
MTQINGSSSSASLYRTIWRWHFFAALIVIPFVLWQSTTGSLYLWSEWWMDVMHPELRFVEPSNQAVSPSTQIAAALATAPRVSGPASDSSHAAHRRAQVTTATLAAATLSPAAGPPVVGVLLADDVRRSTIVLMQDSSGLPYPIFVNPHDARVLGRLPASGWLPGLTRALHGGWPIKPAGSWLLELGDGWTIVTLLTGLYMWWPRGRGIAAALWPRVNAGTRILLRDLHACVAVWFSLVLLFFLISALPWTDCWGGRLLASLERVLNQTSPAGFSPGGASSSDMTTALPSLDQVVAYARVHGVKGTLDVRLAPWPGAPLYVTNVHGSPSEDRTLLGDARSGTVVGEFRNSDLPVIPRLVALGVHVHQGDFGPINVWLNTAFAVSLIWLSTTGVVQWWLRRPRHSLGVPPKARARAPVPMFATAAVLCLLFPLLGASVLCIVLVDRMWGRGLGRLAESS